jgi:hypothetical protein
MKYDSEEDRVSVEGYGRKIYDCLYETGNFIHSKLNGKGRRVNMTGGTAKVEEGIFRDGVLVASS